MLVELRQEAACEFIPADRRGVGTEVCGAGGSGPHPARHVPRPSPRDSGP